MTRWLNGALARIEADYQRSADTHLIPLPLPAFASNGIDLYLKDESTHPTGSLKHRLARSLFLYALCNGWLREGTTVVEASSGSTAVSEAYFARLLGLHPGIVVAGGAGDRPFSSSFARMKASIGFSLPVPIGTWRRTGFSNAQCRPHGAPWEIHSRNVVIWCGSNAGR